MNARPDCGNLWAARKRTSVDTAALLLGWKTTCWDTNASNALDLVMRVPNSREVNNSVVPRSLGRATVTGPAVVLTVVGQ